MRDITILYQGGSGGFALFYYLLLSGKYHTGLEYDNIQDLINEQFPDTLTKFPNAWKHKEFWPNNKACKESTNAPRLFLICNPTWDLNAIKENLAVSVDTYKILLYTNFKLQLRMCWEKQAYWFTDTSKIAFNAPQDPKQYIRQIINTQVSGLDPELQRVGNLFKPDQKINLLDFVKTKTIPGFDSPNQSQINFLNRWLELQPKRVQKILV